MFYNQPLAHRFGTALAGDIESEKWNRIEIAVAWVRRSGTQHLKPSLKKFLGGGGFAQITIGVDIENTSAEGLRDFLDLQADGSIETHIHHNEAATTFHPKVYLLRNDAHARLIVGSNNLTGAGLFVNTEAGLQLDAPLDDSLIRDARTALATWRDPNLGLAKRLDTTLLDDLVRLGYVFPEQELQARRRASGERSKAKRGTGVQALFKTQRYAAWLVGCLSPCLSESASVIQNAEICGSSCVASQRPRARGARNCFAHACAKSFRVCASNPDSNSHSCRANELFFRHEGIGQRSRWSNSPVGSGEGARGFEHG